MSRITLQDSSTLSLILWSSCFLLWISPCVLSRTHAPARTSCSVTTTATAIRTGRRGRTSTFRRLTTRAPRRLRASARSRFRRTMCSTCTAISTTKAACRRCTHGTSTAGSRASFSSRRPQTARANATARARGTRSTLWRLSRTEQTPSTSSRPP
eukprot:Amastigsp_a174412_1808.p4 type:complete len:155 gc:universal Amastigsp_a174412_1808:842-378(-)